MAVRAVVPRGPCMKGDEASNVERSFLSALALVPAAFAPLQLQQDQLRKGPNGKVDFSP